MRGKAEISYTDSRGNEFNLMSDGLRRIKSASFHEYSWNKDVSSKRFGEKLRAFKKDALSLSATIYFDGPDREQHLNEFHDATEYDIVKGQAGTLTWEEYSIKCFVISSKTHPAEERFGAPAANEVVFYCPDPFWTKVQSYSSYTANDRPVKAARIAASKNPIKELTGELVHFDDAKEGSYLPKTELVLEPKQDLHGYDHPWVGGAGKNLFSLGDITVTGQSSRSLVSTTVIPAGTYTISAEVTSTDTTYTTSLIYPKYQSGSWGPEIYLTRGGRASGTATFTDTVNQLSFYASKNSAASDGKTATFKNIQIEKGSTATAYEPYENICPIEPYDTVELYHNDSYSEHNIWDEEWENGYYFVNTSNSISKGSNSTTIRSSNYIPVFPNTEYYRKGNIYRLFFFDNQKNYLSYTAGSNMVFRTPSNCHYVLFYCEGTSSYAHDICININISDPDFNGQYEPYHNSRPKLDAKPYLVRPASQLGKKAYDKLVGMSVGWNQVLSESYFYTGISGLNVTIKNHIVNITGTPNAVWANLTQTAAGNRITLNKNHVYCAVGTAKGATINFTGFTSDLSANVFTTGLNKIIKNTTAEVAVLRITDMTIGQSVSATITGANIIDLTAALTSQVADYIYSLETANAGDGVAFFREHFPEVYYGYNAGELIHTAPTAKEVTGKNLWGGAKMLEDMKRLMPTATVKDDAITYAGNLSSNQWFIKDVFKPDTQYTLILTMTASNTERSPEFGISYADGRFQYVKATGCVPGEKVTFATVSYANGDKTIKGIFGYRYDGTPTLHTNESGIFEGVIDVSDFEPYKPARYPYPNVRLGGIPKIVNGQLSSDGDTLDSDGTLKRKYGLVDLGTVMWNKGTTSFSTAGFSTLIRKPKNNSDVIMVICGKPMVPHSIAGVSGVKGSYECYVNNNGGLVWYYPLDAYSDGAAFKTAMSGVMLLYELAEPVIKHVQPFVSPQKVDPAGLEIYEDKRPVPIPVCHETKYYDGVMHQFKSSQFGGDVYGLTIDLVSGVVKKTHRLLRISDFSWATYNMYSGAFRAFRAGEPFTASNDGYSDSYDKKANAYQLSLADGTICYNSYYFDSHPRIVVRDDRYEDATEFKVAMGDRTLVVPLLTPETYQLTPRQLKALTGDNYVWGSDGIVSLAYISDFDPHMLTAADGTPITPQEGMIYIIQEGSYKDHEFIWNGEEYLDLTPAINKAYDLSYPYEYDYKADFESYLTLTNDNVLGSSYIAIIYGPCTNPDIILANDGDEDDVEIAINTDVPAGGRLVVDMTDKTVTKYMPDGSIINAFGQRDLDAGYLWTKVPYGLSHVIWDGSFDFDLLLIEERSEPKWLLG